jgi:hypothetical protein
MIGTLSNLGRAQKLMRDTDLDAARLSALATAFGLLGLSESTLSRALRAGKLNPQADETLGLLVRRLENLVSEVAPLMVSFADTERVAQLLNDLESRRIVFVVLSGLEPNE